MVRNKVRTWNKDATIVINISGSPATGKTSLCKMLGVVLSRNNIGFYYTSFTGFHNFSYLFSEVLHIFFKLLNKVNPLCKNDSKVHPYDCIPIEYTDTLSRFICFLEILSLYLKALIVLLKIAISRPRVVLLDEGFPHIILNYIMFFYTRKSKLYRFLNKHAIKLLYHFLKRFKLIIIFIIPPQDKAIKYWIKRDPYLSSSRVVEWVKIYYAIIQSIVKVMKEFMNVEILLFSNTKEAFYYILRIVGAGLGSS
jgi:hypothetical protein